MCVLQVVQATLEVMRSKLRSGCGDRSILCEPLRAAGPSRLRAAKGCGAGIPCTLATIHHKTVKIDKISEISEKYVGVINEDKLI